VSTESKAYYKLLGKAMLCVDSPGADDPDIIWERLGKYKGRRGYTPELVRQIVKAHLDYWREHPPERIPLSPDLQRRLDGLGRALGRRLS